MRPRGGAYCSHFREMCQLTNAVVTSATAARRSIREQRESDRRRGAGIVCVNVPGTVSSPTRAMSGAPERVRCPRTNRAKMALRWLRDRANPPQRPPRAGRGAVAETRGETRRVARLEPTDRRPFAPGAAAKGCEHGANKHRCHARRSGRRRGWFEERCSRADGANRRKSAQPRPAAAEQIRRGTRRVSWTSRAARKQRRGGPPATMPTVREEHPDATVRAGPCLIRRAASSTRFNGRRRSLGRAVPRERFHHHDLLFESCDSATTGARVKTSSEVPGAP